MRGHVYAEGRKNMVEQPLPTSVIEALKGDAKGYFEGFWSSTVGLMMHRERAVEPKCAT